MQKPDVGIVLIGPVPRLLASIRPNECRLRPVDHDFRLRDGRVRTGIGDPTARLLYRSAIAIDIEANADAT